MMNGKPKPQEGQRVSIIHAVNTPLGFFTLSILAIEFILGSLTIRAEGIQLTLLIFGMLISFFALLGIVFVLSRDPKLLNLLLGKLEIHRFGEDVRHLDLSPNDIRLLYYCGAHLNIEVEELQQRILQNPQLPLPDRLAKLQNLDLIKCFQYGSRSFIRPTEKGQHLTEIIDKFASPIYGHVDKYSLPPLRRP